MHILYLQQLLVLPEASGNDRCWEFAQEWKKAGHRITFITSNSNFPAELLDEAASFPQKITHKGIDIHVLDVPYSHMMPFSQRIRAFLAFYQLAQRIGQTIQNIDLILAYSAPLSVGYLGRQLSLFHKKPLVFEVADVWPDVPIGMKIIRNPLIGQWLHGKTRQIYEQASHIITFSDGMAELIKGHGVPARKISVSYNGVNLEAFPFQERGIQPAPKTQVLYTGTIGKANGLSQLLDTIHYIEQLGRKDISFTIVGDGNEGELIRQRAKELRLTSLSFHPRLPREKMAEVQATANIGVVCFAPFPVLETNGATKFFDYLAGGLPVVINYQGWQAKYLTRYKCGLSSKQGDNQLFAKNILLLADNPILRNQLSINGRRLAENKFGRTKLAAEMLNILEKVVEKIQIKTPIRLRN